MMRTQISLTEAQRALLDAEAHRTGRSISALIREAVEGRYQHTASSDDDLAAMRRAFGAWPAQDERGAGDAYVEELRSASRMPERPHV